MSSVKHVRNALFFAVVTSVLAFTQSPPNAATQAPSPVTTNAAADLAEISTSTEPMESFHVRVNLVEVRVVVRDAQGKAIGGLKQEDFVLLDDKKPQTIKRFSEEQNDSLAQVNEGATSTIETGAADTASSSGIRRHLGNSWRVAYFFDDFNSTSNDLINARKAAEQAIDALAPGQLLGIFTFSGQGTQDFTGDKALLRAAVAKLKPSPQGGSVVSDCPPINYYIADQYKTYNDPEVFKIVLQQVIGCQFDGDTPQDPVKGDRAKGTVSNRDELLLEQEERATRLAIDRVYRAGETQADIIFHSINEVLRHVSQFGGERIVVLLSPGYYVGLTRQPDLTDSLNRAIDRGVVINTLDLRGVVAQQPGGTDISQRAYGSSLYTPNMVSQQGGLNLAQSDTLMQMSNATGGKYYHNNNDISGGLANLSAPPEFSYLLAFSPQNLANDGKFHNLKIELKQRSGFTVQARKGYFAPLPGGSNEQVKREIAEAVFSHDEIRELPLRVQTQFFRSGEDSAKVAVLVHIDVRHMQFKKAEGRNLNELTVVAALFDRNDNFVSAKSSTVKMHIKDQTLDTKLNSGITVRSNFSVNPGNYLVRIVARDVQGKMLTQNEVVQIQ